MEWLRSLMSDSLSEWLEPIVVIFGTVFAMAIARTVLLSGRADRRWGYLARLSPSVVNLIAVIGFKLFVETAPLTEKLAKYANNAVFVLTVVFVLALIRKAALVTMEWGASHAQYSAALQQHGFIPLVRNILNLFVFFAGAIMILQHFGYDVLSLLTALGVGSLAVGLAAKETLSNMISGFILIMDRNLVPGDRINLAGAVGDVQEIGLRSTRIKTGDGNTLIVPNFDLVNNRLVNLSEPTRETTVTTTLRVPYSASFADVKKLCQEVLQKTPKIRADHCAVLLMSLADGFQSVQVVLWLTDMDASGEALTYFNETILQALAAKGIRLVDMPWRAGDVR